MLAFSNTATLKAFLVVCLLSVVDRGICLNRKINSVPISLHKIKSKRFYKRIPKAAWDKTDFLGFQGG